jgi:hypothetical protein
LAERFDQIADLPTVKESNRPTRRATEDAKTPDVFGGIRALDILPRSRQSVANGPSGGPKPMIYTGVLLPSNGTGAIGQMRGGPGNGIGAGPQPTHLLLGTDS